MNEDWGDAYLSHYEKYFRPPVESQSFVSLGTDSPTIQILRFDKVFKGCRVFASLGLTHFSNEIHDICEIYMPADDGWEVIPKILANTIFYLVQKRFSVGQGTSIGIESFDLGFSSRYNKSAVYLAHTYGLPEEFGDIKLREQYGRIFLAILLTRQEHNYFADHGAKNLEKLLMEKGVDPYSISRPSCI